MLFTCHFWMLIIPILAFLGAPSSFSSDVWKYITHRQPCSICWPFLTLFYWLFVVELKSGFIMKQINVNFLLFISWLNDAYICTCTYILCFPSGCETYEFSYTLFMTNDCLMICLNYQEKRIASKRNYWYISSSVRFMFKWVISPLTAKHYIITFWQ